MATRNNQRGRPKAAVKIRRGNPAKAIALIQQLIEGDAQEQKETGELLIERLDAERESARKLFPKELKGISW